MISRRLAALSNVGNVTLGCAPIGEILQVEALGTGLERRQTLTIYLMVRGAVFVPE